MARASRARASCGARAFGESRSGGCGCKPVGSTGMRGGKRRMTSSGASVRGLYSIAALDEGVPSILR